MFWRNRPFNNTLIFADFCCCQQKLEVLWQQAIYQEIPFYLVYKLTKFHDQSISQTGFMAGGAILPHPGRMQGQKSPAEIGLKYNTKFKKSETKFKKVTKSKNETKFQIKQS